MRRVDEFKVNIQLIEDVCVRFVEADEDDGGSILVFLPGAGEIKECHASLSHSSRLRALKVLMLHSNVSPTQQRDCFAPGRKVILSTNVAEASLTIPNITCVIDTGLSREVGVSARSGTGFLRKSWCSKASTKQRAGRAGRVRPGVCYRLFSRWTWGRMREHLEPEIKRMPLEEVVVAVLEGGADGNSVEDFLSECPDPPEKGVKEAVEGLVRIGAVRVLDKGERLTRLGISLVKLNVPCRVAKVVLFSVLLKCAGSGLGIAALLAVGKVSVSEA